MLQVFFLLFLLRLKNTEKRSRQWPRNGRVSVSVRKPGVLRTNSGDIPESEKIPFFSTTTLQLYIIENN